MLLSDSVCDAREIALSKHFHKSDGCSTRKLHRLWHSQVDPRASLGFLALPRQLFIWQCQSYTDFFHLIFMTGCCIRPYNSAPRCKTKKGGTGEICFFCYQKDSCVRMLRQSNITQIYKNKLVWQFDGLVTFWICIGNISVRAESEFGVWWSNFWLVRQVKCHIS